MSHLFIEGIEQTVQEIIVEAYVTGFRDAGPHPRQWTDDELRELIDKAQAYAAERVKS